MLEEERTLFTGDLILEGATPAIVPPEGDMAAYMESLESLRGLRLKRIAPAHGYLIENPKEALEEYITHRTEREQQVLAAVGGGAARVEDVVSTVYPDLKDDDIIELAQGTVHAHLLKLKSEGSVKGTKNWALA